MRKDTGPKTVPGAVTIARVSLRSRCRGFCPVDLRTGGSTSERRGAEQGVHWFENDEQERVQLLTGGSHTPDEATS